jgi:glutathionylspermidine synthase
LHNEAILAVVWETYPHSPYRLEKAMEPLAGDYGWLRRVGIPEDETPITGNFSRFRPHVYRQ